MGHTVEKFALRRGHEVVARIDKDNQQDFDSEAFRSADVAIEFSVGSCAPGNILNCLERGIPVVSGTTGWLNDETRCEVASAAAAKDVSLIMSANFSVGVNITKALNRMLARIMNRFPAYRAEVEEIHHTAKIDHPSGTAIAIAEEIIDHTDRYDRWAETERGSAPQAGTVDIRYSREGDNPGYHRVSWTGDVDRIAIEHQAFSRDGFAEGAVVAAEWITAQPKGQLYDMQDMLKNLF